MGDTHSPLAAGPPQPCTGAAPKYASLRTPGRRNTQPTGPRDAQGPGHPQLSFRRFITLFFQKQFQRTYVVLFRHEVEVFFLRFGVRKKIARLRKNASFRPLAASRTNRWRLNAHHQPFSHVRSWVPWIQLKRDRGSQVRGGNKFCLI